MNEREALERHNETITLLERKRCARIIRLVSDHPALYLSTDEFKVFWTSGTIGQRESVTACILRLVEIGAEV